MSFGEREDAAWQLAAVQAAQRALASPRGAGARQIGWLSVLLGLLLGALHVLLHFFTPQRSLTGFWVLCATAAVAITVLALGYRRLHRVLPAGFGRRYLVALAASLVLYAGLLALIMTPMPLAVVLLLGAVVALPLAVAGGWMIRQ